MPSSLLSWRGLSAVAHAHRAQVVLIERAIFTQGKLAKLNNTVKDDVCNMCTASELIRDGNPLSKSQKAAAFIDHIAYGKQASADVPSHGPFCTNLTFHHVSPNRRYTGAIERRPVLGARALCHKPAAVRGPHSPRSRSRQGLSIQRWSGAVRCLLPCCKLNWGYQGPFPVLWPCL